MHTNSKNPCFGKRPSERDVKDLIREGIVVIDKPDGPSSHKVAERARNILEAKKAGHIGTLDTNATGVLPILLGRATNAASFLMKHEKEYVGTAVFKEKITEKEVGSLFEEFMGEIWQIPPIGAAVARKKRKRMIYSLKLIDVKGNEVIFKVRCEAGTYIRTLVGDIGKKAGNEAKLIELRRTKVGSFSEKDAVTLQELEEAYDSWKAKGDKKLRGMLHPMEDGLGNFKKILASDKAIETICNGAQLMLPGIERTDNGVNYGDIVAIMNGCGELVAFAEAKMSSGDMETKRKGQATKTLRVIIQKEKMSNNKNSAH